MGKIIIKHLSTGDTRPKDNCSTFPAAIGELAHAYCCIDQYSDLFITANEAALIVLNDRLGVIRANDLEFGQTQQSLIDGVNIRDAIYTLERHDIRSLFVTIVVSKSQMIDDCGLVSLNTGNTQYIDSITKKSTDYPALSEIERVRSDRLLFVGDSDNILAALGQIQF